MSSFSMEIFIGYGYGCLSNVFCNVFHLYLYICVQCSLLGWKIIENFPIGNKEEKGNETKVEDIYFLKRFKTMKKITVHMVTNKNNNRVNDNPSHVVLWLLDRNIVCLISSYSRAWQAFNFRKILFLIRLIRLKLFIKRRIEREIKWKWNNCRSLKCCYCWWLQCYLVFFSFFFFKCFFCTNQWKIVLNALIHQIRIW